MSTESITFLPSRPQKLLFPSIAQRGKVEAGSLSYQELSEGKRQGCSQQDQRKPRSGSQNRAGTQNCVQSQDDTGRTTVGDLF